MQNDELPQEIFLAVQRVFEQQSIPVPVDALNSLFPNEASLAHTAAVQARLAENQREIQKEIDALHEQLKKNQDPDRMQLIQEMISELLGQMSQIREKATESEAVVRSITKDIQVLDLAKKNLILSMTTLKRLQMLVNALSQLEELVSEKKYREISQTLSARPSFAVKQLSSTFSSYRSIPRVMQAWKHMQELQNTLRSLIDKDFDAFYLQDKSIKPTVIEDACLAVDVLGSDFRLQLIERYVALELKEYRRIFRTSDEAGQLDNISRRFSWFRRLLQTHELEQGRVFPSDWKVSWHLLAKFTEITRDDITTLLSTAGKSLTVKTLLDNLQIVAEFESSMAKKWATPYQDMLSATVSPNSRLPKPLTHAFDPHMSVFVDAQDKALSDMLVPHRKSKSIKSTPRASLETFNTEEDGDNSSPIVVLPSSTELFYFYGQSLEQCARLSRGSPLFDLCNVHKKWLRIYAEDVLTASLKQRLAPPPGPRKSVDSTRFDIAEVKQASMVINTADYCQTTASELEEKIRSNINEEFKEQVSFQQEQDLSISAAIVAQLRELESACEPAFTTMSRSVWSNLNSVSGPSAYIAELVRTIEQFAEALKPTVEQKKYLRNFFDKASSLIVAKFTNSLVKSRPLKEVGAEQLLIDLQLVKAYLAKMPGESLVTPGYNRSLSKSTGRLESLLKVIVTPVDPPEGFILNYTLLIGDASFSNFQKILDLKGTPKSEQNHLLDSFVAITSTKDELQGTSFLSSLDMDPPNIASLGGTLASPAVLSATESIFSGLVSPPISGPPTGSTDGVYRTEQRREVFSDFKRFVSFGLRRDSSQVPSFSNS
ncbi:hypothetical protein D9757_006101 [Collybiopsis confluens]|uniref:Vps53 N-terminal domain-containing protein n=1 Tax=Collybiopsis confluens TaxID=2823264 RepID=A0A8H5HHM3_9AGAR|nr:hypothetical protein D9757_006101 [Collybiopsis confluens]